jgi:hypothetical protein
MEISFLSLLITGLLITSTTLTTSAQDKVLTEPIELIKTPELTHGIIRSGSNHGSGPHLSCHESSYNPDDIVTLVDGVERSLTDSKSKLKPESVKSIRIAKRDDPEFASYFERGKKAVILVETHQSSNKSSR